MNCRHVLFALAAAGALGLAACETDNVSPASSGGDSTAAKPAPPGSTAGSPNAPDPHENYKPAPVPQ